MRTAFFISFCLLALRATSSLGQTSTIPPRDFPTPRWGVAAAVGGGFGTGSLTCVSCADGGGSGAAGFGRLGGAYRSDLIVAAQIDWMSSTRNKAAQREEVTLWAANLVLQWFPSMQQRWFVTSGLGVGFADIWTSAFGGEGTLSAHGLSYQLGGGYELPLGTHVALTPYGSYFATPRSRITDTQERLTSTVVQIGVGLGWR